MRSGRKEPAFAFQRHRDRHPKLARPEPGCGRAAVVDLDVHQGDGTALLFEDEPGVLTLSMHGAANFPFRKQRSKIDVALADGTSDAEYLSALDQALPQVLDFHPEIVFYQSGVDALASDTLGRLAMRATGSGCATR